MAKANDFSVIAHGDQIRKTFRKGQRTIIIEGRRFALKRQDRRWKDPHTQQLRRESWIIVTEIGKDVTGISASIEMIRGGNLRSIV